MKKFKVLLAAIALTTLAACSQVPPGHVGIAVDLYGSDKGVDNEVLGTGRYWMGWNRKLYVFPTFIQTYSWTAQTQENSPTDESITFQDRDGMSINADVGITYKIDPERVPLLFTTFRMGVDEITRGYLRNQVRDAFVRHASMRKIDVIYGEGKTQFLEDVKADVRDRVAPLGIEVQDVYLLGELRLPEVILSAINAKLEANQRAIQRENEVAQTIAEANKAREQARGEADAYRIRIEGQAEADAARILTEAQARAEANELLSQSITPDLNRYFEIQQWNGELPGVMLGGEGSTLLSLPQR